MSARVTVHVANQQIGVELRDGVYRFGRQKPADIVVPDPTVSSNHAELQIRGDDWFLRDLGSTNGTFVNDEQVRAATKITDRDRLRIGSVHVTVERVAAVVAEPQPGGTVRLQAATEAATVAAKEAAGRLSWATRYWVAGAEAIVFLLMLFFFVQIYTSSAISKEWTANRYRIFAEQYVHVLTEGVTTIPAPILDDSLAEPILIVDRTGRILYPVGEGAPKTSPLIDPKTKAVYQNAKYGLFVLPGSADAKGVSARSYPVRSGGDLRGFVVARPGKADSSNVRFALGLLMMSAVIALIVLFFALRPVNAVVISQLDVLRSKIQPLANGFIDSLPRSGTFPEANAIAAEIENAVNTARASAGKRGGAGGRGGEAGEFASLVADLFSATGVPYCIVDQDFKAIVVSGELRTIRELAGVTKGLSIFDAGLSSVQSKQLVQTIGDARRDRVAHASIQLTRGHAPQSHAVTVEMFENAKSGAPLFGIAFNAQ